MLEMPRDALACAIVDRIYEAAFAAELWPDALEAASALSRLASGAIFLVSDHLPVRAIGEAPAEARLATELASGRSVQEAAIEIGVAVKSARTYLERIFRKTGNGRQSQLEALLRSARTFS
ncbi:hypothetical protein GCM10010869_33220 [Mesorhizobium tianshanense]|uniref:DNA-binding CsgD family transcriptional regulator n=2 Tax=Mesorhizobium tianshanense TaxID=39844 RepID=A0A562P5G2_9HYPH|nr:DNA-binding CsgD family transcriptional regulator [Mesorhizobium tianshanense]GLS37728.1 hypothetical protein GCM10010869_33220 [Mesorhizobium tianshanense]